MTVKFSIVLPTRNRADKLVHAIRSATCQTFDDYELLISNNGSTDHTARSIAENATDRCRVIAPPQALPMCQHWEFALQQARGDRVLILCDDDALLPNTLERLDRISTAAGDPDLIQYECFTYIYDDGVREKGGNTIRLPSAVSDEFRPIDLDRSLRLAYWRVDGNMPKLLNCVVHRRLLDAVREKSGRIFGIWAPDYAVGVRLLALGKSGVRTGPLAVWGENMQSYGPGAKRDPAILRQFMEEHDEWKGLYRHTPYPGILSVANGLFDTMEIARRELKLSESRYPIDPIRYRKQMIKDLRTYQSRGVTGLEADVQLLEGDLRREQFRWGVSPGSWSATAGNWLRRRQEKSASRSYHRDDADESTHTFGNIYDAARAAGSLRRAA